MVLGQHVRWSCGITDCPVRPVRISLPPMMIGMSSFSPAICFRRAFSSARSGVPGAYDRLGSFTGGGTRRAEVCGVATGDADVDMAAPLKDDDKHPFYRAPRAAAARSSAAAICAWAARTSSGFRRSAASKIAGRTCASYVYLGAKSW
jgi:hypothetical protein